VWEYNQFGFGFRNKKTGSRDVIGHVTIQISTGGPLLWTPASILNSFWFICN